LRSTDGGATWNISGEARSHIGWYQRQWTVRFASPQIGVASFFGDGSVHGLVIRTTDGGLTWSYELQDTTYSFYDVSTKNGLSVAVGGIRTDTGELPLDKFEPVIFYRRDSVPPVAASMPVHRNRATPHVAMLRSVTPNPVSSTAVVSFILPTTSHARVSLMDMTGRELLIACDGMMTAGEQEATLDARSIATGMYLMKLVVDGRVLTRCVQVVR
jgi:hypothetical protein